MAQKNKVKELVGRSLNSYHTKALQQMDRIEKKNKEQNHKISILSNELDNDYLTKTEEGSVISLEHSKEGMVYLDELQGNTLVNYCTDGSKELTLNGDIDTEGTFVTTTEGVDNGKVDVMCEGNTEKVTNSNMICWLDSSNYVNGTISDNTKNNNYANVQGNIEYGDSGILADRISIPNIITLPTSFTIDIRTSLHELGTESIIAKRTSTSNGFFVFYYQGKLCYDFNGSENRHQTNVVLRPNILYRITFVVDNNKSKLYLDGNLIYEATHSFTYKDVEKPIDILYDSSNATYVREGKLVGLKVYNKALTKEEILLDEGYKLQSVGQDDENGHKIEILSQNKNLYKHSLNKEEYKINTLPENFILNSNGELTVIYADGNPHHMTSPYSIKCKPNTNYTISANFISGSMRIGLSFLREDGSLYTENNIKGFLYNEWYKCHFADINTTKNVLTPKGVSNMLVMFIGCGRGDYTFKNLQIEEGLQATSYIQHSINKKEILLNKPLRDLPNGLKDKFVKINNKWFIERNTDGYVMNTTENWRIRSSHTNTLTFDCSGLPLKSSKDYDNSHIFMKCNLFECGFYDAQDKEYIMLRANGDGWIIGINRSKLSTPDVNGFKKWLSENRVEVVYKLDTTTYEPLEIEPTLNTYNDITHISNNSIIPCNMKIQNSGYNAIIKPSTLYTVALDTNKNGTIGFNLGGAKGTTTNNVLKLTTPATLTDDSLRLYGKGIKGSKVRLLEGDKTNWIPSHFEGMKSSFEDKFDTTDNTYKMEILSNNENLFNPNNSNLELVDYNGVKCYRAYGYYNTKGEFGKATVLKNKNLLRKGVTLHIQGKGYKMKHWTQLMLYNIKTNRRFSIANFTNGTLINRTITLEDDYDVLFIDTGEPNSDCYGYIEKDSFKISLVKNNKNVKNKSNKIQFSSIEPLRGLPNGVKDRFVFKDNKLMIERNTKKIFLNNQTISNMNIYDIAHNGTMLPFSFNLKNSDCKKGAFIEVPCNKFATSNNSYRGFAITCIQQYIDTSACFAGSIHISNLKSKSSSAILEYFNDNNIEVTYQLAEPTYEEIPFELQKIILENYENGTLFFDTNIPPTSTVTYAGETPIVKATKLNKTEVLNNTNDINDNIVPYLMDMDYRVVCLQLQLENTNNGVSMARLFGGTYEMLQRDIQSKRYSVDEYKHRLDAYLDANKITEEEYNKLGDMLNE